MRETARAARAALDAAAAACGPGVETRALEAAAHEVIASAGAEPLFLGYRQGDSPPFPARICVSVNDEVVHGIPGRRTLAPGDVVSIDVGIRLRGWCADTATTVIIAGGAPADDATAAMVRANREILDRAAAMMRPGLRWSEVASEMESLAACCGFALVTEYVGHGIGRALHEPPRAPAYWSGYAGEDFTLEPGLVLAVEPMLCLARPARPDASEGTLPGAPRSRVPVRLLDDGWTVVTADGSPACHEEEVVAITERGAVRLTAP